MGLAPGRTARRAVLVDDDRGFLLAVVRSARRAPDLALTTFETVEPALAHIAREAPDVVVLDYLLRETDGIVACRQVRALRDVPVVIVSGHASPEMREAAREAGACAVLQKPCDVRTLFALGDERPRGASETLTGEQIEIARRIARRLAKRYGALISADDIDGFAMVGLCEAARRYDPAQDGAFLSFAAYRIRGAVLDELRRVEVRGKVAIAGDPGPLELLASSEPRADERLDVSQHLEALRAARVQLTPEQAAWLALRFEEGLSAAVIAERHGVTEGKVVATIERGLVALRSALGVDA